MSALLEFAVLHPLALYKTWRLRDASAVREYAEQLVRLSRGLETPGRVLQEALRSGESALRGAITSPTAEKTRHIDDFFAASGDLVRRALTPRALGNESSRAA